MCAMPAIAMQSLLPLMLNNLCQVERFPLVRADVQHQRHIELTGTVNLRSLGGYHTIDGTKTTKWGVLYRCDHLSSVPADVAQSVLVNQVHIRNSFDLRGKTEVMAHAYHIPNINRYAVPVDTSAMTRCLQATTSLRDAPAMLRLMREVYSSFVTVHGLTFGKVIKKLVDTNVSADNASLIHCTAGKDRTGWTVYLILSLLGVKEEEKRMDYMMTNTYYCCPKHVAQYLRCHGMSKDVLKLLWSVYDEFLDAAIEEVNKLGGVEAYAKSHMGLTDEDIRKLRELLLE